MFKEQKYLNNKDFKRLYLYLLNIDQLISYIQNNDNNEIKNLI